MIGGRTDRAGTREHGLKNHLGNQTLAEPMARAQALSKTPIADRRETFGSSDV